MGRRAARRTTSFRNRAERRVDRDQAPVDARGVQGRDRAPRAVSRIHLDECVAAGPAARVEADRANAAELAESPHERGFGGRKRQVAGVKRQAHATVFSVGVVRCPTGGVYRRGVRELRVSRDAARERGGAAAWCGQCCRRGPARAGGRNTSVSTDAPGWFVAAVNGERLHSPPGAGSCFVIGLPARRRRDVAPGTSDDRRRLLSAACTVGSRPDGSSGAFFYGACRCSSGYGIDVAPSWFTGRTRPTLTRRPRVRGA